VSETPILDGLRVVELAAYIAAPLCGATLASMGADVVRVDPPGGGVDLHRWPLHDGQSLYWVGLNQGKRSVTINSREPRGRELILALVAEAGTCVTNLPVGDWLTYEALRARRPDPVLLRMTGNPDGTPAVDYTVNAAMGFPWITGPEDETGPVNHVLPAWDVIASQMATSAIVAAELKRARGGEGSDIEISLANVALFVASHLGLLSEAELASEPRGRYGNYLYGSFGRDFRTADARYVIVIALTTRHWRSLVSAIGAQDAVVALERAHGVDLADEAQRWARRREIAALVEAWTAARPLADVARAFDAAGVLWSPYQTFKQLMRQDARATAANPIMRRIQQDGIGLVPAAASPVLTTGTPSADPRPAPRVGAHTREVLTSRLGISSAECDRLAADGVISLP